MNEEINSLYEQVEKLRALLLRSVLVMRSGRPNLIDEHIEDIYSALTQPNPAADRAASAAPDQRVVSQPLPGENQ